MHCLRLTTIQSLFSATMAAAMPALAGRGEVGGGIVPVRSRLTTFSQAAVSFVTSSKLRLYKGVPKFRFGVWQLRQYVWNIGPTADETSSTAAL